MYFYEVNIIIQKYCNNLFKILLKKFELIFGGINSWVILVLFFGL